MATKRITDVDVINSLDSDESFFVNQNSSIKQINKRNVIFGISNGGTGATTVAGARNALGLGNTDGALPIANGGTGATTVEEARNALDAAPKNHTHDVDDLPVIPISKGGTGKTSFTKGSILLGNDTDELQEMTQEDMRSVCRLQTPLLWTNEQVLDGNLPDYIELDLSDYFMVLVMATKSFEQLVQPMDDGGTKPSEGESGGEISNDFVVGTVIERIVPVGFSYDFECCDTDGERHSLNFNVSNSGVGFYYSDDSDFYAKTGILIPYKIYGIY